MKARGAKDNQIKIQRSKGLGENEADMMALTTMNPDTRRLIKVTPDDIEHTTWMFDMLLGENLQARKEFISNNGIDYLDMKFHFVISLRYLNVLVFLPLKHCYPFCFLQPCKFPSFPT